MHACGYVDFWSRAARPNPQCTTCVTLDIIGGDMIRHHYCNNCALEPPKYILESIFSIINF